MLQRTTAVDPPPVPGRPFRVLIEDPALIADELATPSDAIEVTVCSGLHDEREVCPLVMDGTCPLEPCDTSPSRRSTGHGRHRFAPLGRDIHRDRRRHRRRRD